MSDIERGERWEEIEAWAEKSKMLSDLFDMAYQSGSFGKMLRNLSYAQLQTLRGKLQRFTSYEEDAPLFNIIRRGILKLLNIKPASETETENPLSTLGRELREAIHQSESAQKRMPEYLQSFRAYAANLDPKEVSNNINDWTLKNLVDVGEEQEKPQVNKGIIIISTNKTFDENLAFVETHIVTAMHMHHLNGGR